MSRQAKYVVAFAAGALALLVCLCWFSAHRQTHRLGTSLGWGHGKLETSERAYYTNRINTIISAWQEMAKQARRSRTGEVEDSHFTCLVVDTGKKEIGMERDGRILPLYHTDLPERMVWKLRHCGPHENTERPAVSRFRIRGVHSKRLTPERFYLVGTRGNQEHVSFSFSSSSTASENGSGPWRPPQVEWPPAPEGTEASYGSILVSENEYEEAKRRLASHGDLEEQAYEWEPSQLKDNNATWTRAEKRLYQEIDRQVTLKGFELRTLEVNCGPDYLSASAELGASRSGWLSVVRRGPSSASAYLKIDYLENDVWYVKSAPHPLRPMPPLLRLDLEFLASATGQVPEQARDPLLQAGREKQRPSVQPPSKRQVRLANGVRIEFVGIGANPSAGQDWWGPDGNPLGYAPYVNYEPYGPSREDRKVYEIAWRIYMPSSDKSGTRSSLEGCVGSYGRQIRDRYGSTIHSGLHAQGYAFDRSREKTTLKLGVKVGDGEFEWVTFKNISLLPSQDQGFEIVRGQGDTKE